MCFYVLKKIFNINYISRTIVPYIWIASKYANKCSDFLLCSLLPFVYVAGGENLALLVAEPTPGWHTLRFRRPLWSEHAEEQSSQRHYSILELETSSLVIFPLARPWSVDLGPVGGFCAGGGCDVQVARAEAPPGQAQSCVPRPCWRPAHHDRARLQLANIYVQLGWTSIVYYSVLSQVFKMSHLRKSNELFCSISLSIFFCSFFCLSNQ